MSNMSVIADIRLYPKTFPFESKILFVYWTTNYEMKIFLGRKDIVLVTQTSTTQWLSKMRCDIQVFRFIEKAILERKSWNHLSLLLVQMRRSPYKWSTLLLSIINVSESRIKHKMCPSPNEDASEGLWSFYLPCIDLRF